ncbi:MAG: hypothetical protein PHE53_06775 [Thermoguttaceae bacterium]|nr:hypothetical protein [Thermoguttaceae bacterium]
MLCRALRDRLKIVDDTNNADDTEAASNTSDVDDAVDTEFRQNAMGFRVGQKKESRGQDSVGMDLIHRIAIERKYLRAEDLEFLVACGLPLRRRENRMIFLSIRADDPCWPRLESLVQRAGGRDVASKSFTSGERHIAEYLAITPVSYHGHPGFQPLRNRADDFFVNACGNGLCEHCGAYETQTETPLVLAGEIRWENRDLLQIDPFRDLWFTTPKVYAEVFEPFGVTCREVRNRFTDERLRSVVQLLPTVTDVPLHLSQESGWPVTICPICGIVSCEVGTSGGWLPAARWLPRFEVELPADTHFFTSRERFSDRNSIFEEHSVLDKNCWRACFASQTLFRQMLQYHLRGVYWEPLGWEEMG